MENQTNFKVGDRVLVSPQVTGEKEWIEATIIEVEQNPFVGFVSSHGDVLLKGYLRESLPL